MTPYKGLAAFGDSDLDALLFFGRGREIEVIVANLIASRLTVLYGATGVGKSSILRAGVAHRLRQDPDVEVIVWSTWTGDSGEPVREARRAAAQGGEVFLVLDQFEEYFLYHRDEHGADTLAGELPELLGTGELRVNVLISLREDALAQLDSFKGRIPNLFANYLRLAHLDRAGAQAAILGPVARWNELEPGEPVEVEPELVDAVLDGTIAGRVDFAGGGRGTAEETNGRGLIEAPFLQLVMERLWESERESGSHVLRLETFRRLGGAQAIVREHVDGALDALASAEKDVAASVFNHLVTPSGTKIAHRASDLADYARVREGDLRPVLATLGRERILRSVDGAGDGAERYEIFHDILADPVLAWRTRRRLERERQAAERRQRRLLAVAAVALVALAGVTTVAVYAFVERGHARRQARLAQAHELQARSTADVLTAPQRSLREALDAALLDPSARAETVLRQALISARLRDVLAARGPVLAVAYGPDGKRVLTASADGRARLYDARTGALVHTIRHRGPVVAVAFNPDGTLAASGDRRGIVHVWETSTGRELATLTHRGPVTEVSFTRDGSRVLTASRDGTAALWQARTGRRLRTFRNPGAVSVARLSPDGRVVATAAADRLGKVRARLFDARSGRLLHVLEERGLAAVAFSPDGRLLATGSHDGATRIHRVRDGKLLRVLDDGGKAVLDAAFSPNGRLLATAQADGGVRIWNPADGSRVFLFPGHGGPVVAVAWSSDGNFVVDASLDHTSRIWQVGGVEQGSSAASLTGHDQAETSVAFSPDGRFVVTGSDDGTARIWDARTEQKLELVGRHRGPVTGASFDAKGARVVSAGADRTARIWNARGGALLQTLHHRAAVNAASFSTDGQLVVTASGDRTAMVWRAATGAPLHVLRQDAAVRVALFDAAGRVAATGAADGTAALWSAQTGRKLAALHLGRPVVDVAFSRDGTRVAAAAGTEVTIASSPDGRHLRRLRVPGSAVRVAFSPDGKTLATAGGDGTARLWDVESGKQLRRFPTGTRGVTDVVFSPDGRTLLTTTLDRDIRTWDVATGAVVRAFIGTFGTSLAGAFSPDGRWVVTAGPIAAVLWPADSPFPLFYLRGHTDHLTSVSFAPDARRILTSSRDGTVRIYDCEVCGGLDALERLARVRLSRSG